MLHTECGYNPYNIRLLKSYPEIGVNLSIAACVVHSFDVSRCQIYYYTFKRKCTGMHTETTRSSGYWLGTVLLLYLLRTDAARVAGCVTT